MLILDGYMNAIEKDDLPCFKGNCFSIPPLPKDQWTIIDEISDYLGFGINGATNSDKWRRRKVVFPDPEKEAAVCKRIIGDNIIIDRVNLTSKEFAVFQSVLDYFCGG